jgi:subfamily B ATP-binding cassette protein HlyB/CyaB
VSNGPLFATGTFVWGLAAICQLHRRPFAPNLLLQQFAPPYGAAALEQAAAALQLKAGLRMVAPGRLHAMPVPFIAILEPSTAEPHQERASAASESRLAVVLECDASKVLYLTESSATPTTRTLAEFSSEYSGVVLLCGAKTLAPEDDDPAHPLPAPLDSPGLCPSC